MFACREEVMSCISEEERKEGYSDVRVCDMFDPCFCTRDGGYSVYGPKLCVDTEPSKYVLLEAGLCRGVRRLEYNAEIVYSICGKKGVPIDNREHCIVDNVWKYTSLEGKIGFCDDCWAVGAWGAPYGHYLPIDVENNDYQCLWLDSYLGSKGMALKRSAWRKKRMDELAEKKKWGRLRRPL